jgi:prefoldin subunit 5
MDQTTPHRTDPDRHFAELIESTTRSLREERDRLAKRLADLERELENLAARLESPSAYVTSGDAAPRRS